LFDVINGWTPAYFFWRRHTLFSLPRILGCSLLSFCECSLLLVLRLGFLFHLYFCSELVSSL
jgi:hypothetical protein